MIVCIAEKPSVARDIAEVLGAHTRKEGYIEGNGYQVTWTFGHLCTLKEPHEYTQGWKSWSLSSLPMIPGSSLKGKMRTLLAKEFNGQVVEPENDHERIARLFGSSKKEKVRRSRLLFADMVLANEGELRKAGLQSMTEVKFENSISRATAIANPRQIERTVAGSVFELDLIYELEKEEEFIEKFIEKVEQNKKK